MDLYDNQKAERAEIYKLFSSLLMKEPEMETLRAAKELFRIESAESPDEISKDYEALFRRPDLHLSPHESLYVFPPGDEPMLWGKATMEVQTFYESAGLILDVSADIIPDHLSVELLFMSYLIDNGRVEEERRFLEKHLFQWVPDYCDLITSHAGTLFFRRVADILKGFIISEYELMGE